MNVVIDNLQKEMDELESKSENEKLMNLDNIINIRNKLENETNEILKKIKDIENSIIKTNEKENIKLSDDFNYSKTLKEIDKLESLLKNENDIEEKVKLYETYEKHVNYCITYLEKKKLDVEYV